MKIEKVGAKNAIDIFSVFQTSDLRVAPPQQQQINYVMSPQCGCRKSLQFTRDVRYIRYEELRCVSHPKASVSYRIVSHVAVSEVRHCNIFLNSDVYELSKPYLRTSFDLRIFELAPTLAGSSGQSSKSNANGVGVNLALFPIQGLERN